MNSFSKIIVLAATVVTMGSLAACQSTTGASPQTEKPMRGPGHDHRAMKKGPMSPEDRSERQAAFAKIQQACEGKTVGQSVQITLGDKVIDGTCQIGFKPNKPEKLRTMPPAPPTANAPVAPAPMTQS